MSGDGITPAGLMDRVVAHLQTVAGALVRMEVECRLGGVALGALLQLHCHLC